jgi:hypothetical protein
MLPNAFEKLKESGFGGIPLGFRPQVPLFGAKEPALYRTQEYNVPDQ